MLILGVLLLFLGPILLSISKTSTPPVERWLTVQETDVDPPKEELSVQGELADGDKFRVYFTIQFKERLNPWGPIPKDLGVIIMNLTEPSGNVVHLPDTLIEEYQGFPYPRKIPEGIANATGTYQVDAKSIGFINLDSLRLEKLVIYKEEPYSFLLPVSALVTIGGIALSIFGVKTSKEKRRKLYLRKKRLRR